MDCSVAMGWCFGDQADAYTYRVLDELATRPLVVPVIWPLEVANTLVVAERRKKIGAEGLYEFLALIETFDVAIDNASSYLALTSILELARQYRITAYDASYLELASRLDLPLATRDSAMKRAAEAMGIKILSF